MKSGSLQWNSIYWVCPTVQWVLLVTYAAEDTDTKQPLRDN